MAAHFWIFLDFYMVVSNNTCCWLIFLFKCEENNHFLIDQFTIVVCSALSFEKKFNFSEENGIPPRIHQNRRSWWEGTYLRWNTLHRACQIREVSLNYLNGADGAANPVTNPEHGTDLPLRRFIVCVMPGTGLFSTASKISAAMRGRLRLAYVLLKREMVSGGHSPPHPTPPPHRDATLGYYALCYQTSDQLILAIIENT